MLNIKKQNTREEKVKQLVTGMSGQNVIYPHSRDANASKIILK